MPIWEKKAKADTTENSPHIFSLKKVGSHINARFSDKATEAEKANQFVQEEAGLGASNLKPRPHVTAAPHSHSGGANTGWPLWELPALSSLVPFSPRATWEAGQSLPVHSHSLHELLKSSMLFFDFHAVRHAAQLPRMDKGT